jgi:hypothetical protein
VGACPAERRGKGQGQGLKGGVVKKVSKSIPWDLF